MLIHEAIRESNKNITSAVITRKQWNELDRYLLLTEPIFCYVRNKEPTYWAPQTDDLMANDWEVCNAYTQSN